MNAPANWQSIGDIARRLVEKETRQRGNAPGQTATNQKEMAMNYPSPDFEPMQSPAEARRTVVFHCDTLSAAQDLVVRYARNEVDQVFAINGMPRAALPWRMPTEICPASAVLAAHLLAEGREATGAEMLSNAMFLADTDCVVDGLCVAEDLAIVSDNFVERFGDDA
jgi:hypothetical protein